MDGTVNKLLVDDKGTLVVAAFGLPPHVHPDAPQRAIAAALLMLAQVTDPLRDSLHE